MPLLSDVVVLMFIGTLSSLHASRSIRLEATKPNLDVLYDV